MFKKTNKIGTTLKKIRKAKGISQKEIANYAGISQSNYSKYELGKIDVNSEALIYILDILDITFQEFYYIHNNYKPTEKELILQNFFNIPFQNLEALKKFKVTCEQYLFQNYSPIINDTVILCDALISISKYNDFETARTISSPIWNRLSNNDDLFVYDLYFLNAILYIFPIDEVLNVKDYLVRAYNIYNKYPKLHSVFINLHINISLLLIENCYYSEALTSLTNVEELCRNKRLYFQLSIILIRKGICLNNLDHQKYSGSVYINEGKKYLNIFSETETLTILEKEIDLYNP